MFVVGGESLIDLVAEPMGADDRIHMTAHAGGSPYNCAIALARLGNKSGFLCPISKDAFGDYLLIPLLAAGARPIYPHRVAAPTSLATVNVNRKGQAQYEFYRSADRAFDAPALIEGLPGDIELFQIGGFCVIEPEDASIWLEVVAAATRRGAAISIDPNVRPSLVSDFGAYRARLSKFFDKAHLVKLSDEDLAALNPDLTLKEHASALLARPQCRLVVITRGEEGSLAFTANEEASAEIYRPERFGDTVGAGDSLMAAIITWLAANGHLEPGAMSRLGASELKQMLTYGAVVAGLNCAEKGCNPPTSQMVSDVLATL